MKFTFDEILLGSDGEWRNTFSEREQTAIKKTKTGRLLTSNYVCFGE